jgi:predicted ATPase
MLDRLLPSILCPILIGRDAQVAVLARLLEQARGTTGRSHGQIALISGEARATFGRGKSRLMAETRKLAIAQGLHCRQSNCFEPDRVLPYAPLIDLLRTLPPATTLPNELSALLSGQHTTRDTDPEQAKRRLFATLIHVFVEPHSPFIILEDLHWCDDSTLEFLLHFARTMPTAQAQRAIGLLLTYRKISRTGRLPSNWWSANALCRSMWKTRWVNWVLPAVHN